MKAYKATYNGKCLDITYEVGKIYTLKHGKLQMCKKGFHFCKNIVDLKYYYDFIKDNKYNEDIKVFEIEVLGETIENYDKCISNKIKIVKELKLKEILEAIEYRYKYDENNNLIWQKDCCWNIYEYKYDENNNLIWEKSPNGDIWKCKYDENNNVVWEKYPSGNIYKYKYDENNNIILKKDPHENIWEYKFDENNNKIWEKLPSGNILEWEYK